MIEINYFIGVNMERKVMINPNYIAEILPLHRSKYYKLIMASGNDYIITEETLNKIMEVIK